MRDTTNETIYTKDSPVNSTSLQKARNTVPYQKQFKRHPKSERTNNATQHRAVTPILAARLTPKIVAAHNFDRPNTHTHTYTHTHTQTHPPEPTFAHKKQCTKLPHKKTAKILSPDRPAGFNSFFDLGFMISPRGVIDSFERNGFCCLCVCVCCVFVSGEVVWSLRDKVQHYSEQGIVGG
jgi:hypothetical protein